MSCSSATSEAVGAQTELARLNRDKVRETLEKLHSQSTDLLHFAVNWNDLECRFDSIQKSIDDQVGELNKTRLQLDWKSKFLKKRHNEIEFREKELEVEKKELDDRCEEIDHTYQLVSMCHERAEEKAQCLEEKLLKLKSKEERLVSKLRKIEKREDRLVVKRKMMKRKFGSLKNWNAELLVREKRMIDRVSELNLREKKLNSIERGLLEQIQDFEPRVKKLTEAEIKLKNEEVRFHERHKVFINNEKCMNTVLAKLKGEEIFDADIRFYITMNGRELVSFLNNHASDLENMRDEVTRALKLSSNPAKLVLDAMQGFYGYNSEEILDLNVVRSSCILLLEQLTELEPQIKLPERERARLLALKWKTWMKEDIDHNMEIVGFLQLVGAYKLTYGFNKDELAKTIETVAYHIRAPALCRRLGLEDEVHDIVVRLIQDKHAVDAVRFIHEFDLVDAFPPVPILRNFLESVLSAADNISEVDSFKKEQVTNMILAALHTVIKCIKELKLDSEFSTEILEEQVSDFQRQRGCCPSDSKPLIELETISSTADQISFPPPSALNTNCNLSPIRHSVTVNSSAA